MIFCQGNDTPCFDLSFLIHVWVGALGESWLASFISLSEVLLVEAEQIHLIM